MPVTNFPNTNGKLFFNGYGTNNAYCSASALNTDTKRVIITAGHCVYDSGAWKQNVVFVPNYDIRNADPDPVGIWTVHTLRTFNSWINNGDLTWKRLSSRGAAERRRCSKPQEPEGDGVDNHGDARDFVAAQGIGSDALREVE